MVTAEYVLVFIIVSEAVHKSDSTQFVRILTKVDFKPTVEIEFVIEQGELLCVGFVDALNAYVSIRSFRGLTI